MSIIRFKFQTDYRFILLLFSGAGKGQKHLETLDLLLITLSYLSSGAFKPALIYIIGHPWAELRAVNATINIEHVLANFFHIQQIRSDLSIRLESCLCPSANFSSILSLLSAMFCSPPAPEGNTWLVSFLMLHYVHKLVANIVLILFGAEQRAFRENSCLLFNAIKTVRVKQMNHNSILLNVKIDR